jgi:GT2 family glycosyltransferase
MLEPGLTVAIPTMRRWSFLEKQLPVFLNHPLVSFVVISDETGEDVEAICAAGYDTHPKLRLYVNDRVLGVYGNKRQCMLRSGTEWVAILDSDNEFDAGFIDAFWASVKRDGVAALKTVYCAGVNKRLFLDTGKTEDKIGQFSGKRIGKAAWNQILGQPGWNYLFNNGNAVWPATVAAVWPDMPEERIVGTDSIFAMRQAIRAGYTLCVEPTMAYTHTVHNGSHWLQHDKVSTRLMNTTDWRV